MFEKVNPSHPDKIADRIAGALVDLAYKQEDNPRIAVEVQIGHGLCNIIAETSTELSSRDVKAAVSRISGRSDIKVNLRQYPQDAHLAWNQSEQVRCGDNGIFRGVPVTDEQRLLTEIAKEIYAEYPYDGKYLIDTIGSDSKLSITRFIICQSNADRLKLTKKYKYAFVNPLGDWSGGLDVDTGMTNRKLGSDLGDSNMANGLFGKDLSKSDVSVSIYTWLKAQETGKPLELFCAIGDRNVCGIPYGKIVDAARKYISDIGGFEKFAEWGLIR